MNTKSAKQKGRRFQQWIVAKLIEILGIDPQDLHSRTMGESGEDIIMAAAARNAFPFSIEAKAHEKINVYDFWAQACANAKETHRPILFLRRNNKPALIVLDAVEFLHMQKELNEYKNKNSSSNS